MTGVRRSVGIFGRIAAVALAAGVVQQAFAFEYDVRQPGDVLRPKWFAADTQPGVFTLNVRDALQKAQAAGKCTVVFNTASWWCPYCETLEETVLTSAAWREFVADEGFYLGMLDFPYRNDVPKGQEYKSWYPELGKGWGFKCWLMFPEYLSQIGLTKEQGLDAIMDLYQIQKSLAYDSATQITISNWTHTAEFTYGKVGYPRFIVFGPDGTELGRADFPWYRVSDVTPSEAQEYVIQSIDQIVHGECRLCEDPLAGEPPVDAAQTYTGWISSGVGGIGGQVTFKTSKASSKGMVTVSGSATVGGKRTTFASARVRTEALGDFVVLGRSGAVANVKFGEVGLSGSVYLNGVLFAISGGGRDVFKAKDDEAKKRAAGEIKGVWNVVLKPTDAVSKSAFAKGYGALSVELKAKGKARISGTLGDGTKVGLNAQAIYGDDGVACLPVQTTLYAKKGGFGFVMWFRNGKLYSITEVAPWVAGGADTFIAGVQPMFTMSSGSGNVESESELSLIGFDPKGTIDGCPLAEDPTYDDITVIGSKWLGTEVTSFSASCTEKSGLLRGSMYFYVTRPTGRVTRVKGTFNGVVMGGSAYGNVVVKGDGSWAVKIAVCGGCSE